MTLQAICDCRCCRASAASIRFVVDEWRAAANHAPGPALVTTPDDLRKLHVVEREYLAKVTSERDVARTLLANAELRIMRIERDLAGMERQAVDTSIVAEAIITGPAIPSDARLESALIEAIRIARGLDLGGVAAGRLRDLEKLVGS